MERKIPWYPLVGGWMDHRAVLDVVAKRIPATAGNRTLIFKLSWFN